VLPTQFDGTDVATTAALEPIFQWISCVPLVAKVPSKLRPVPKIPIEVAYDCEMRNTRKKVQRVCILDNTRE